MDSGGNPSVSLNNGLDILVDALLNTSKSGWDVDILDALFDPDDVKQIRNIHVAKVKNADRIIWIEDEKGEYTMKSSYRKLKQVNFSLEQAGSGTGPQIKWSKHPGRWIKLNVDVALDFYNSKMGFGFVLRNSNGTFMVAKKGANVNERDQNGWTALHRVAFKGRMECVNMLVSHGAEIGVVDGSGFSVRPVEKMNSAVTVGWG
ncbi:uncharacterized protein LOC116016203 [Ipomoea triloba]|uniref:uncharacterized protein LOC116016203 n=1 Tax=Ipomoea triloba TaxID=35885 RepID=UPI00125DFDC8|nr:uncharacterized protein LOC116016203 [Ipomoea triloba]